MELLRSIQEFENLRQRLILSRDPKLGLTAHWKTMAASMGIVSAVFWVWDVIATARGHWSFNDLYVLGVRILGMPVEEWLFFVVVTFVSIFTWESTKYLTRRRRR